MRLFTAIELPDSVRALLQPFYQYKISGAKWVPLEQIHLTLRFIGEVEEELFQNIRNTLSEIKNSPFHLTIQGVGCFPNIKRPHVLWVGLKPEPFLETLQQQIESKLNEVGLIPETRTFSPHLTLARLKSPNPKEVERLIDENKDFKTADWSVKEFHLYSSTLTPNGAVHKVEESYLLKGF